MRRLQCGDNKFYLFHHLFLFQDFFCSINIIYIYNHLTTYIYKMVCWLYLLVIQEDFVLSKWHVNLLSLYYKQCMTDKQSIFLPASIIFVDIFIAYSG